MANIAALLKQEISRIVRKELKAETEPDGRLKTCTEMLVVNRFREKRPVRAQKPENAG